MRAATYDARTMPSPERVAAIHPWLLTMHITLVTLSVTLFATRALGLFAP